MVARRVLQNLADVGDGADNLIHGLGNRAVELVLVNEMQLRQVPLRDLRGEEWEQAVDVVLF